MTRVALVLLALTSSPALAAPPADVVVYGGSAGGVIAAIAVAREGKSVVLLEPGTHIGGMVTGGLGATDTGQRGAIGGYSREVFARIRAHYEAKYGKDSPQAKACDDGYKFEPHVAHAVLTEMLKEAKVEVKVNARLAGQTILNNRILGINVTNDGKPGRALYQAQVFIDASYEGDLLAAAKVPYHVGREAKATYNESIAGVQARSPAHQFAVPVPAFRDGKLRPLVRNEKADPAGNGDAKVQAYNFRLCLTDRADLKLLWPKPADYDTADFELLGAYLAARPSVTFLQLCNPVRVPNGKTDTNNNGPISTDVIGANWLYPDAGWDERDAIRKYHVNYTKGLFYYLANEKTVPAKLQAETNKWGPAKDEFSDTDNWPHQLYVREARRMIGAFVMTQTDLMTDKTKPDSVGLGSYNTDSHHVQRLIDKDGNVINEGDFQVGTKPYAIPYRSLTPKAEHCPNLLVPVCCSASHVAYGSIRMEPVYMILGQASGVAACLAIDGRTSVQAVSVDKLTEKLKAQKTVLSPDQVPGTKPGMAVDVSKLPGVLVDDEAATFTGDWKLSSANAGYVAAGYRHDDNADKGKKTARFVPKLPAAGMYEVYVHYVPNANRATNVPVAVNTADGEKAAVLDQRQSVGGGGRLVGVYSLAPGAWVELRTAGTDGHVIADAVRFVPVPK